MWGWRSILPHFPISLPLISGKSSPGRTWGLTICIKCEWDQSRKALREFDRKHTVKLDFEYPLNVPMLKAWSPQGWCWEVLWISQRVGPEGSPSVTRTSLWGRLQESHLCVWFLTCDTSNVPCPVLSPWLPHFQRCKALRLPDLELTVHDYEPKQTFLLTWKLPQVFHSDDRSLTNTGWERSLYAFGLQNLRGAIWYNSMENTRVLVVTAKGK